ncbi:ABC transporter, transmembrane region:ABC transporter [Leucobacter sp. 7(1)]|uniref:ABC transporter ATP-binding protein n=1 Tax=Leucobacter sp. 7(1) TaxID=1255613 RepID=UPI00097E8567|nr:ABC transporter ATP-binding protein [Leucobacter sp. 7(1)]SJN10753.1 ABC transporter, transmembrane region:ABC transporter [Leucobacter sp. 7(1)]
MVGNTQLGVSLPIATGRQVWHTVRRHLRTRRRRLSAVAVLFLAASALGLVMPACLGRIVDAVTAGAGFATIALWVGGVAVGAIGAALMGLWAARVLIGLVQDVLAELREEVFSSAMRLPARHVDDSESADLLSRVTGDVDAVSEAGGNVVPGLLSAGFAIAVSVVALAALNPWLALAGLACVPFYALGTRAFLRRSRVVFREIRAREAARSQAVIEAVHGHDTLTALNEQGLALERVAHRAEASIRTQVTGVGIRNRLFRSLNGGEAAGLIAILGAGFVLHMNGVITVGAVTAAALVFHRLFDPIGQLIFGLDDIQRAAIGLARLVGVIELASEDPATPHSATVRAELGSDPTITVDSLTFRYPGSERGIADASFVVPAGTTTVIVGASGSGKSTLARVIAGHDRQDSGQIHIEPAAVPYALTQEIHLFRGSIADNMRLAAPSASDSQIADALSAAGADWALLRLAGEPGSSNAAAADLDDGRIQQLAIARALLADPAAVILDEATADVGLQHRADVDRAVEALRAGRTTVLIAHQLHHAADADEVLVCADGAIVQCGTHAELLQQQGHYQQFWNAQSRGLQGPQRDSGVDPAIRSATESATEPTDETETP